MTSAASAAASSPASASTAEPITAILTGPPACCAAAIASHDARLSLPSRCSADHQDHSITLASSRSFWTSALAAAAAGPGSICVFLPFSGKWTRENLLRG